MCLCSLHTVCANLYLSVHVQAYVEITNVVFLSSCCHMALSILYLFLMVPWAGLQCVIGAVPDHTYFFFSYNKSLPSNGTTLH